MTQAGRQTRVVSLLPAGTEIVAALGAMELLAGVSHACDHPAEAECLPRVTSSGVDPSAASGDIDAAVRGRAAAGEPVFTLHAQRIAALAPGLIITQALCDVCAVTEDDVRAVTRLVDPPPAVLSLGGTTLAGVWADIAAVGRAIGRPEGAEALLASIAGRLRVVHDTLKEARAPRPRVAVIEWLDPLYGAGHWCPELVRRAGGVDVLAEPGAHSVSLTVDQLRAARPELLLFAPCGFPVERAAREARMLLAAPAWRWAEGLEAWALDGNALTSRPGPRLADAVEVMASIFAPGLFGAPNGMYARRVPEGA